MKNVNLGINLMPKRKTNKAKRAHVSIFDAIPCYGWHGDINTLQGIQSRLECDRCKEFMKDRPYNDVYYGKTLTIYEPIICKDFNDDTFIQALDIIYKIQKEIFEKTYEAVE